MLFYITFYYYINCESYSILSIFVPDLPKVILCVYREYIACAEMTFVLKLNRHEDLYFSRK